MDSLRDAIFDSLLSLNFTNEEYAKNDYFLYTYLMAPLGVEMTEEAVMQFSDGTVLEVSYYCYDNLAQGSLRINGKQFFFSTIELPRRGLLIYDIINKDIPE